MSELMDVSNANEQIKLFETVYEEVQGGEEEGLHILTKVGQYLKKAFDDAETNGNKDLMEAINDAWDGTQSIISIVKRQAIALRGGNGAFKMLKAQRDQVTRELEKVLRGLYIGDEDVHPAIEAFAKEIRGWEDEYLQQVEEEVMEEMFHQHVTIMFEKYTRHPNQDYLDMAADGLFDLITEEKTPTDEQKVLLQQLAETFYEENELSGF